MWKTGSDLCKNRNNNCGFKIYIKSLQTKGIEFRERNMRSSKIFKGIIFLLSMTSGIFILIWSRNNDLMPMLKTFSKLSEKALAENTKPIGGKNIFFLETLTSEVDNFTLSARQACSMESAAKMNPRMQISLLILSNAPFSSTTVHNLDILSAYKNIAIKRITLEAYLKNSPLEEWWRTGIMNTSIYPTTHFSDVLRLVTLWKFGGIYLDLDMIVMRSLENMTNFAATESDDYVNGAALGFSETGVGKKFINAFLQDLKENFKGHEWSEQGPLLITRVLKKLCGNSIADMISNNSCQGFTVYPTSSFYPIHWENWKLLFAEDNYSSTMNALNESFAVHFWNACRGHKPVKVTSRSPYVTLASKYCPKIFNTLDEFI